MHKTMKRIAAGLVAITASLSAAAASAPMSVFAEDEQILIQSDFEAGMGLPWHTLENAPARQDFDISDGTYNITILNNDGPESRWDLQLRCRNLVIQKGHTYKVHWKVNSSEEGELYTKIANYGGNVEVWHNNCGNDNYNQTWECVKIAKGDNTFDAEFTAKEDIEVAEWVFEYGGQGMYQPVDCFPDGTILKFDDLSLIDTTPGGCISEINNNECGVVRPESNVRLNQIGYYPQLEKKASYVTDASSPLQFEIRDKDGNVKYKGTTKVFGDDPDSGTGKTNSFQIGFNTVTRLKDSGSYVHIIDFSDFRTVGEYTIFVKDTVGVSGTQVMNSKGANDTKLSGDKLLWTNPVTMKTYTMNESSPFRIDRQIYDDQLLRDSMNYFYQNRSGVPIESEYITSGDKSKLAHDKYGHNPDIAYVQSKWVKNYEKDFSNGEKDNKIDVTGGWYAANDHGKYVVEGGFSVWTLQNAYEFSKRKGNTSKWTDGTIAVPENKDNAPDILDEARVELEWMFKMINEDGFVYHSVQDHTWVGPLLTPWKDDTQQGFEPVRIVRPPTYAATFNMIACAAQASRLWKDIDDDFAKECLQNARNSWKAIMAKQSDWDVNKGSYYDDPYFAPSEFGGNNIFGDTYVVDDAYWAACELYATTGDSAYYDFLKDYKNYNDQSGQDKAFSLTSCLSGGENNGSFGSFNWGNTAGLGTLSLYLSDKTSPADRKIISNSIQNIADQYIAQMRNQGMGIPYKSVTIGDYIGSDREVYKGYEYGSNSFVINNAMVLAYAYDTDDSKYIYRNGAAEALDYIYGRNGLGFSYVSGYGDKAMSSPHHRYWANSIDPSFPAAPSGVLAGGPCSGMYRDNYLRGLGYKKGTLADQKYYVDSAEAWSVNDVSGSWNAPLVWMSSFMNDRFGSPKPVPVPYPTNIKVDYSEEYHQARFTWNKVENADRYGIAVYLAGKWRVQKQDITGTTYTSPKNLTPGVTYKVAIAARVNGKWDTENAIKRACTVTIK